MSCGTEKIDGGVGARRSVCTGAILERVQIWFLGLGVTGLVACGLGRVLGWSGVCAPALSAGLIGIALGLGAIGRLRWYRFTVWIVAAVVVPLLYPGFFREPLGINLQSRWLMLPIIQLVMFGMGTQMSLRDFLGVLRMPWGVVVGIVGQFTIMPVVGYVLAKLSGLPPEIGAGVVLIGSCSSGLASNVMNYIARANLGLSVTLTAVTTMLAPVMTPFWMKVLAGRMVEVDFWKMMADIIQLVLVPVGAAMVHDWLKGVPARVRVRACIIAGLGLVWSVFVVCVSAGLVWEHASSVRLLELSAFLSGMPAVGVVFHYLWRWCERVQRVMPVFSMFGIIFYTAVTTAAGRNELLVVGPLLVATAMVHNVTGYLLGYWFSRVLGLNRLDARTVAIEVGMQNGGMATGLAAAMGKLGTTGLAAIVFSPWMNISGSLLANYWRTHPPREAASDGSGRGPGA